MQRINREILHPLGLAVSRNPDSGNSEAIFIADDGIFSYAESIKPVVITDDEIRTRIAEMAKESSE